ncbi:MAG: bifunctional diaminohydroxyphosphoribosylaminopyrimidine deaminase/5-amino-6-(5-phosphoribosylamino)uracil reductase RibD [Firmicutes bacterium]|nr:bifunctional diaminohydroxyphosphoribosylaminopyrimidine deaminase/5-amino-6-(5-phosphoribosylamino)uracil reductase RibD [Bacillota bacterium]
MDIKYMKRAIELSKLGKGYTNPNPLVGAVIVRDGKIIAEGYHKYFGGDHAEINAFKNTKDDLKGAEMYVTLEPCSHYGKTPPCALEIVKKGISKVYIGMKDPNPKVSGKGIKILRDNNILVTSGILESEVKKINEVFIKYIKTKLPFIVLKTAMTLDGKIATKTGDSKWISNELSREYTHKLRHKLSGILVGIKTVLKDNPRLTTRLKEGGKDPERIILDSNLRIPLDSKVLNINSKAKTIIATTKNVDTKKIKALEQKQAIVIKTPSKDGKVDLKYLIKKLGDMDIDSILIEGGSTVNYSALNEGIVDKVISFISPKIIGGVEAKTPVGGRGKDLIVDAFKLKNIEIERFNEDIMIKGYLRGDN